MPVEPNKIPKIPPFEADEQLVTALITEYRSIRTIPAATAWEKRAQDQLERVKLFRHDVSEIIGRVESLLAQEDDEFKHKSYVLRKLDRRRARHELKEAWDNGHILSVIVDGWTSLLENAIANIPRNKVEQAVLLSMLWKQGRKLAIRKQAMNGILPEGGGEAPQPPAAADTDFGALQSNDRTRNLLRMRARLEREAVLGSFETETDAIERQLKSIGDSYLWLEGLQAE